MRQIIALRHGNASKEGHLTPEGEAQIAALSPEFKSMDFKAVLTSEQERGIMTGELLCPGVEIVQLSLLNPVGKDPTATELLAKVKAYRAEHPEASVGAALGEVEDGVLYMQTLSGKIWGEIREKAPEGAATLVICHENTCAALLWQASGCVDPGLLDGPHGLRNVEGWIVMILDDGQLQFDRLVRNPWYQK